jgi:microcystin-dependent protein
MPISLNDEKQIGSIFESALTVIPTGYLLCDGSAISRTTYSSLFSVMPNITSTVTMTIASPCVVTWSNHGLATGHSIQFSTAGALPIFSTVQTVYFIRVINTNTFNLYTTLANAINTGSTTGIINTSGTQSGIHTGLVYYWGNGNGNTTFNIPDAKGAVLRGEGTSSDYTQNVTVTLGSKMNDVMQGHKHYVSDDSKIPTGVLWLWNDNSSIYGPSTAGYNYSATIGLFTGIPQTDGTNGTPRTATETRVKSIGIRYYIKF